MNRLARIAYYILLTIALLFTSILGQETNKRNGEDNNGIKEQEESGTEPLYRIEVLEDGAIKVFDLQGNLIDTTLTPKMKNDTESLRDKNETGPPAKSYDEIKTSPDLKKESIKEIKSEEGLSSPAYNEMQKSSDLKEEKKKETKAEEGSSSPAYNEMKKSPDLIEEHEKQIKDVKPDEETEKLLHQQYLKRREERKRDRGRKTIISAATHDATNHRQTLYNDCSSHAFSVDINA